MKIKNLIYLFLFSIVIVAFLTTGCKVHNEVVEPVPPVIENFEPERDMEIRTEEENLLTGPLSPYTGTYVDEVYSIPFCVLVENHPKARPQSGLADAELVYEVPVEGGYTRFLAVYASPYGGEIGPVRSSRPYFAYLIKEHNGIMAHCGYSIHTEEVLKAIQLKYIDERFNPPYYRREKSRKMPHNLYTTIEQLFQGAEDKRFFPGQEEPIQPFFSFQQSGEQIQNQPVSKIEIRFSAENFVEYNLEPDGSYLRYNNGDLFLDAETGQGISVKNIIVQFVDVRTFTSEGHLRIQLTGEGEGLFFSGGAVEEIKWKKDGEQDRTFFSGEKGELLISPGNTWIHLVPQNGKAEWSS